MPVFYDCQRCAACCRWPGQVWLRDGEIARLAAFLQLDENEFIQTWTRLAVDRTGLVLQVRANGECIFFQAGACRVQPVKPQQCRDFPNWWRFPNFQTECHAVAREVGVEDYIRRVAEATMRSEQEVRDRVLAEAEAARRAPST